MSCASGEDVSFMVYLEGKKLKIYMTQVGLPRGVTLLFDISTSFDDDIVSTSIIVSYRR